MLVNSIHVTHRHRQNFQLMAPELTEQHDQHEHQNDDQLDDYKISKKITKLKILMMKFKGTI